MLLFYLDTSALLKRYKTEKGTNVIDELFSARMEDEVFVTSHFTTVEVESAASRALKGRVLNKKAYGVLLELFAEDLETRVIALPVSTALFSESALIARRLATRAGDALHLATASRVKNALAGNIVFVTSDLELVQASGADGFTVVNPEDEDAMALLSVLRKRPEEDNESG